MTQAQTRKMAKGKSKSILHTSLVERQELIKERNRDIQSIKAKGKSPIFEKGI